MSESEVLFEAKGKCGVITLNRPQALNALTLTMVRDMNAQLTKWAVDDNIKAIIIEGAGGKAFCAGGDIKTVALAGIAMRNGEGDGAILRDFFREEYTLNHRIFTFPKPYIALIDGIVMGGGKGVSAHGSHRIVTEKTMFAMPETNIGFFPDVGGGYFLPRCPGQIGPYLALTSKRIGATDTKYIGFATHFVPSDRMPLLRELLISAPHDIDNILPSFCKEAPGMSDLTVQRMLIDRCFGFDRIEDIMAALEKEAQPFTQEALNAMKGMSPTSMKIALRQIRLGKTMDFADVMTMEYRLSQAVLAGHDFYEGVRAALIDKDRNPHWNPAHAKDVDDAMVAACFNPLGAQDLVLQG